MSSRVIELNESEYKLSSVIESETLISPLISFPFRIILLSLSYISERIIWTVGAFWNEDKED